MEARRRWLAKSCELGSCVSVIRTISHSPPAAAKPAELKQVVAAASSTPSCKVAWTGQREYRRSRRRLGPERCSGHPHTVGASCGQRECSELRRHASQNWLPQTSVRFPQRNVSLRILVPHASSRSPDPASRTSESISLQPLPPRRLLSSPAQPGLSTDQRLHERAATPPIPALAQLSTTPGAKLPPHRATTTRSNLLRHNHPPCHMKRIPRLPV